MFKNGNASPIAPSSKLDAIPIRINPKNEEAFFRSILSSSFSFPSLIIQMPTLQNTKRTIHPPNCSIEEKRMVPISQPIIGSKIVESENATAIFPAYFHCSICVLPFTSKHIAKANAKSSSDNPSESKINERKSTIAPSKISMKKKGFAFKRLLNFFELVDFGLAGLKRVCFQSRKCAQ